MNIGTIIGFGYGYLFSTASAAGGSAPPADNGLLLEDGTFLLLEDGTDLLLES